MPDRLAEIRARLDRAMAGVSSWSNDTETLSADAATPGLPVPVEDLLTDDDFEVLAEERLIGSGWADLIAHAPADIAWLLAEVERLRDFQQRNNPWWRRDADGSLWAAPPTDDGMPEPDSDKWVRVQ